MKIGIDVDEVLCEFARGYSVFLRDKGYDVCTYEDIFTYFFHEVLGFSVEENLVLINEYICTEEFDSIDLVLGAKDGVERLRDQFELHFITARPLFVKDKTEAFLRNKLELEDFELFFSSDNHGGDSQTKDEYCKENGIGVIIEDSADHSIKYARSGLRVILFDKPWNQGVAHENIVRVTDWDECLRVVKELEVGE